MTLLNRYKTFCFQVPKGVETVPLLLLHGWPGSVREFYEAIPLLTAVSQNRNFAIEVIAPSLPGYGFSDVSTQSNSIPDRNSHDIVFLTLKSF